MSHDIVTAFPFLFIGLLFITSAISSLDKVSYIINALASLLCSTSCFFNNVLALSYDS